MPEAAPLALMRASIDRKPKNIRRVLTDANLRKHLLGGAPSDGEESHEGLLLTECREWL